MHLFAEPVTARVEIVVDPEQFDPERIRITTGFSPYKLLGQVRRTKRTVGDIAELTYTAKMRCLDAACIAPRFQTVLGAREGGRAERSTFRFAPAEIVYEHPGGRAELLVQRPFPAVEVVSRINTCQLDAAAEQRFQNALLNSTYMASLEPPPPTYRLPPGWLAAAAIALAALLFGFPAALTGSAILARWRVTRPPRRLSPLERALLLVEWTSRKADGEQDRRRALEALAGVLERGGALPLAEQTRTYAWADAAPDPRRADEFAAEARAALEGGDGRAS